MNLFPGEWGELRWDRRLWGNGAEFDYVCGFEWSISNGIRESMLDLSGFKSQVYCVRPYQYACNTTATVIAYGSFKFSTIPGHHLLQAFHMILAFNGLCKSEDSATSLDNLPDAKLDHEPF